VLINITGGSDMTLFEVDEAANRIREEVDENANIIFGSTFDTNLNGKIRVSVVATGIDVESSNYVSTPQKPNNFANKNPDSRQVPAMNSLREQPAAPSVREEEGIADEFSRNAFISREPIEPQAVRQQPQQNERFERPNRPVPAGANAPQGSNGLFGSLFSSRREDEVTVAQPQQPQPQRQAVKTQEDELDIPAFMRRKG